MIGIASSPARTGKTNYVGSELAFVEAGAASVNPTLSWTTATTFAESPVWTSRVIMAGDLDSCPGPVLLRYVVSGERRVVFDRGLALELYVVKDGRTVVVSDERFGLYGSGSTYQQALADYSDFFVDFFEDIVNTPSSELPPSTREFRRTLLAFGKLVPIG